MAPLFFYLQGNTVLTINMQDWHGNNRNVRYSHFSVSPAPYFQLNIFGFQGDVPDDLSHNNRANFATYDRPDPNQCAAHQKGGWWYNYCTFALPTGQYYHGGPYTPTGGYYDGIYWKDWLGYGYSLKYISMTLSNAQNKNTHNVVYRLSLVIVKGRMFEHDESMNAESP